MDGKLADVETVAKYLNVSVTTVRRLHRSGELPGLKIGTAVRWKPRDVLDYIERMKSG